jgi:hypothetical protein
VPATVSDPIAPSISASLWSCLRTALACWCVPVNVWAPRYFEIGQVRSVLESIELTYFAPTDNAVSLDGAKLLVAYLDEFAKSV